MTGHKENQENIMRKRFILGSMLMVALTSSTAAWAQVGGGIKVGVNLATLSGFNDPSTAERVGITAGGFLTVGLAPMIAFEPEVLFSMQGSKLHFGASGVSSDVTAKLDYVQVPLLLRLGNSGKAAASLYAVAGPTFGILVRNQGVADQLKNTDVGVVVGAGVTLSRLLLEGRYTAGLTDFNKGGTVYKNRVLSLLVGLNF
jgi:outer membrane protein with beta-barrel domain